MDIQTILLVIVFVVGFTGIVLEHNLQVNKSWIALATGSVMWMIASYGRTPEALHTSIVHSSAEIFELNTLKPRKTKIYVSLFDLN